MSSHTINLLPTFEAAAALGLKRQQFLGLARFLGMKPMGQQLLSKASHTPANLYSQRQVQLVKALAAKTQALGVESVLADLLQG